MILVENLHKPTEAENSVVHIHQIRVEPSWMDSIILFLKEKVLLEDKSEAEEIRRKAPRFWLSEDQKLYKRSFSGTYLLCIHLEAVNLLLDELHEEIYESHTKGQVFVSQGPHTRLLEAKYVEGRTRICEEV